MTGRNLLATACSGLALMAVAGCTREVPRGSIKDDVVSEAPRGAVRGYSKRAEAARNEPTAERPTRSAAVAPAPAPAPAPAAPAGSVIAAPEAPRIVNPTAKPASEAPIREAAAGNVGPGAVPAINGSGSLTARIMEQARQRISAGDVIRAREWLLSAINGSRPEVLHELARTFDPNYLTRVTQPNAVAEPARARALYEEAVRLGAKGASEDLDALLKIPGSRL